VIDRGRVRRAFHRQATDYDRHAAVQRRVVERVAGMIAADGLDAHRLLDVGAGTGRLAFTLTERYPAATVACVDLAFGMARAAAHTLRGVPHALIATADAEHLPFRDDTFDLMVSTSTFQWLTSLDAAFAEAWRVLAPGGRFVFALFGEGTFRELKQTYQEALALVGRAGEDRTHRFFSVDAVGAALSRAGFAGVAAQADDEVEWHPDVPTFLKAVRSIGAGNASPLPARGLAERRVMVEMMRTYTERFGGPDGVPATYTVVYGRGVKPPAAQST